MNLLLVIMNNMFNTFNHQNIKQKSLFKKSSFNIKIYLFLIYFIINFIRIVESRSNIEEGVHRTKFNQLFFNHIKNIFFYLILCNFK